MNVPQDMSQDSISVPKEGKRTPKIRTMSDGAVFVDSGCFACEVAKIDNWRSKLLAAGDADGNRSGSETGSDDELGASNGPLCRRRSNSLPLQPRGLELQSPPQLQFFCNHNLLTEFNSPHQIMLLGISTKVLVIDLAGDVFFVLHAKRSSIGKSVYSNVPRRLFVFRPG